jgi:osmotically inducible protein OsmC
MKPEEIATEANLTMENLTITAIHLIVRARIPGADAAKFQEAAEAAKAGCPVSKVLNAKITMDASLESGSAA